MSGCTALLVDALGTLVRLDPPAPLLRDALARRGHDVALERCEAAMRLEMALYRERCVEAVDDDSLAALRADCAALVADEIGLDLADGAWDVLEAALRFEAFPDAAPALAGARSAGARVAVVSNWDVSLPGVLERCGLAGSVDAVIHSAGVGASKPSPEPFLAALRALGAEPGEALHVGDDPVADVQGARAGGIEALLIDRARPAAPGRIASLLELAGRIGAAA